KEFLPDGKEILEHCKDKGYKLALAVIASEFEERKKQIGESGLAGFFEIIRIAPITKEQIWDHGINVKDRLYDEIMNEWDFKPEEVLIVDDRMFRGIKHGNKNGHPTVWVRNGKFAHEIPNKETGEPTYIINSVKELRDLI
ncbi:MAG TPA: HAD hydrolase-like protein, partial [Candidatus Paceibacterota bacterium]